MKEKYLTRMRKLEELRERYEQNRHDDTYGSRAHVKHIRAIFGKQVESAKGCLGIMRKMIKLSNIGVYHYTVHDPIFYALDERFQDKLEKLKEKAKTKRDNEDIKELQRRYNRLQKKVERVNNIQEIIIPESKLEAIAAQQEEERFGSLEFANQKSLDEIDGPPKKY